MIRKFTSILCLLIFMLCIESLQAQQMTVRGVVTSKEDGEPLPGVSILIKGTTSGAVTDLDGNFSIQVQSGNETLEFSYIGFQRQSIQIQSRSTINVTMAPDLSQLSEVVVTAMGIEKSEQSLGYSTQKVDNALLNVNREVNVVNALQGKIAGVSINSTGGAPGQGSNIQIRGVNSIDPSRDNQPLFVIDGVLMDNSTSNFGSGAGLRGMSNRAADLNPDDIESINVLKGGAATALYGLRGANGVVVITTKRGKSGGIRVNITSTYGFENVNKFPEIQDTYTQGWRNEYDPESFWPSWGPTVAEAREIDPTHPERLYRHVEDAFGTGTQIRNNVSFSGGSESITFMASLSQLDQQGMLPGTDFKNYSARLNTNMKFSDKLSGGLNMSFTNSGGQRYNANRYNEQLTYWSPRHNIRDYIEENGTMRSYGGTNNPIYVAKTNLMNDNVNRFIGAFNLNYKPADWVDLSFRTGVDTYAENRIRTAPGFRGLDGERLVSENGAFGAVGRGFVFDYNTRFRTINSTFIASFNHSFDNGISGTFRIGQELYDRKISNVGVEGADLTVPDWFNLRNANILQATQSLSEYRLMGTFAELTLDYKDIIYLTFTGRNDVTSSLMAPNNSFFYPSASMSYVFSENFELPSFMDKGRFKFSYAEIGKDAGEYSTSGGFASYTGLPTGIIGFTRPALLGDPGLRPEFTETFETGIELGFFKNKLNVDVTYYNAVSRDQIIRVPVSTATGYINAAVNAGSMRNRGFEVTVSGTPIQKGKFSWSTQVNYAANRNMVLDIRDDLNEIVLASQSGYVGATVTMKLIPGEPFGALYGTVFERFYGDDTPDPIRVDKSKPIVIGADGFPVREPVSVQKILGNAQPKWIGGWSNTFAYGDFSLTTLIDARVGQYRYNQLANFYSAFGISKITENRNDYMVFEGVLADGTPNTQEVWLGQGIDPISGRNYGDGFYRLNYRGVSENFVEDASWVRLRSLSLSYNLPAAIFGGKFVRNANISVTGNNLILLTKYSGFDPESSSFASGSNIDGFAGFTYPGVRSFLFTLNLGF
ncbi:SusC/RagA family TonB-linked outer membrane protein [Belliella kenyensis]|uniref:SusC/RagA family TonB-linked outer membrane protein n=1 Tax=Belliella kenyensis TaxID=1472724 RepID=A0ABV8EG84_9BACT|nr:SusC/RagA family TonB-linked outer membrane protein [Belliella kenyensis]MCH7401757.1 SusC/RagA family TonB-linked outer membrane protein [Belliella kenyensis]MDN3604256.1 SusC/RagA family TonB-linked outer membrane protein [Belliella kenyensis]